MSLAEILVVLVLLLVVVGPERLPEVARVIGKGLREIRRATNMFRDTMQVEDDTLDADTFNQPIDQQFSRDQVQTYDAESEVASAGPPKASGGYGRDNEMRTAAVAPAEPRETVDRADLETAESTDAIRWIYVPHPHRNVFY